MKQLKEKKTEKISCHKDSSDVPDYTCDDNEKSILNIEEAAYFTYIHYINATNNIYMNNGDNFIHKYYAPLLSSKNNKDVYYALEYDSAKQRVRRNKKVILDLL